MFDRIMIIYFKIKMLTSVEIVVDLVKAALMLKKNTNNLSVI